MWRWLKNNLWERAIQDRLIFSIGSKMGGQALSGFLHQSIQFHRLPCKPRVNLPRRISLLTLRNSTISPKPLSKPSFTTLEDPVSKKPQNKSLKSRDQQRKSIIYEKFHLETECKGRSSPCKIHHRINQINSMSSTC
jgi:hypothetical protein